MAEAWTLIEDGSGHRGNFEDRLDRKMGSSPPVQQKNSRLELDDETMGESWDRNQHWAWLAQDISIPAEAWQTAIEKATGHLKWCDLENTAATFIKAAMPTLML